jgi:hypothetical protein
VIRSWSASIGPMMLPFAERVTSVWFQGFEPVLPKNTRQRTAGFHRQFVSQGSLAVLVSGDDASRIGSDRGWASRTSPARSACLLLILATRSRFTRGPTEFHCCRWIVGEDACPGTSCGAARSGARTRAASRAEPALERVWKVLTASSTRHCRGPLDRGGSVPDDP